MGQKYVEVDLNNIVLNPYDEDNSNVPEGALPITDGEFQMLQKGFDFFKHEGGILVSNEPKVLEDLKSQLLIIERENVIQGLLTAKKAQIENMNKADLETTIASGGL